jgi:hypothetical protein
MLLFLPSPSQVFVSEPVKIIPELSKVPEFTVYNPAGLALWHSCEVLVIAR